MCYSEHVLSTFSLSTAGGSRLKLRPAAVVVSVFVELILETIRQRWKNSTSSVLLELCLGRATIAKNSTISKDGSSHLAIFRGEDPFWEGPPVDKELLSNCQLRLRS